MCGTWTEMVMLKQRGVDTVCRLTSHRTADFRLGTRLGKDDHIIKWMKPRKPRSVRAGGLRHAARVPPGPRMSRADRAARLSRAEPCGRHDFAGRRGVHQGRPHSALSCPLEHRTRLWRSIKDVLQMDVLRCKTPEMVRKEIWMHLLAYNLIHTVMAQAASQNGLSPRSISFKATLQDPRSVSTDDCQPRAHLGLRHREAAVSESATALRRRSLSTASLERPDRFEPRMPLAQKQKNYNRPDEAAKADQTRNDQAI